MEFRTYLRHFDYLLLAAVLGLVGFGMVMIYSATHSDPQLASPFYYVKVQALATVMGAAAMIAVAFIDFRGLQAYRRQIYFGIIIMVLVVYVVGTAAQGSQRWINLGFFNLQPSELAKVGMILAVSAYLAERSQEGLDARTTMATLGYMLPPALLIFFQPDIGTMLVIVAVTMALLFVSGTRILHFAVLGLGVGVGLFMVLKVLPMIGIQIFKPYQVDRLLVFLHPDTDIGGSGYHLLQSKIAIGSGMVVGKGLYNGTQTQLNFLPEHHTDFIFSVLGEELGFIGGAILLLLYMVVIWRGLRIAVISETLFGALVAAGVVTMLLFQIFVNIGMTIGIMPITGIPLPFMSYGGSAMVANMVAIGLLESIHVRSRMAGDRRYGRAKAAV